MIETVLAKEKLILILTPVFLPGGIPQEQRTLAGYRPLGCKELDTAEQLSLIHLPFWLGQCLPWSVSRG